MKLFSLAVKSLLNRRVTAVLTVLAIAFSVMLLLGVEKVRTGARESFANTISGTDLIVGARGGGIQLLLSSVFRIGVPGSGISWEAYQDIVSLSQVAWTVLLSMGDSHRGFRVVGTTKDYFRHFRYGRKQVLVLAQGKPFDDIFDAVLGAEAAQELGYKIGDAIELTHGIDQIGLHRHDDKPFRVAGILAGTGTPVDRTVHISLKGMEAIHVDWIGGAHLPGDRVSAEEVRHMKLDPDEITAVLVGLKSRRLAISILPAINRYKGEPLTAIMPGVALQELWDALGTAESALLAISILVVVAGFLGMATMTLAGLNERRREMAILRSVGARPIHIFGLLVMESGLLAALGAACGLVLLYVGLFLAQPLIASRFGLFIPISPPGAMDWLILGLVVSAGFIAGIGPAYRGYRYSLADGMIVQL